MRRISHRETCSIVEKLRPARICARSVGAPEAVTLEADRERARTKGREHTSEYVTDSREDVSREMPEGRGRAQKM
jgi:hypothetical protein